MDPNTVPPIVFPLCQHEGDSGESGLHARRCRRFRLKYVCQLLGLRSAAAERGATVLAERILIEADE
eukprot:15934529-Heterocapsa_arctica.AAC.1